MSTANVLSYAEIFQADLDRQFMEVSTSGWMEANSNQVRYNGGNTVKVPKLVVEGLGTYSRSTGFPDGAATLTWETLTMTMDRGKEFNLDAMDYDETNFAAGAGVILGEFQRVQVVPEVDAYRYSQIFQLTNQELKTGAYTPVVGTIYGQLKDDITAIQNLIGESEPLVIAIGYSAANILDQSDDIVKNIGLADFAMGDISTKVKTLDSIPMFRIPAARFKTAYTFSSTNGFSASAVAMGINWIIAARSAIIAIVKTDKPRIFAPEQNQEMDAWKIQYRKYHDLWIKDNAFDGIYVSYTPIAAPALTATFADGAVSGNTKATITAGSGHTLAYVITASIDTASYNEVPTGLTAYASGVDITVTAGQYINMYELDATGHLVKFASHLATAGEIKD